MAQVIFMPVVPDSSGIASTSLQPIRRTEIDINDHAAIAAFVTNICINVWDDEKSSPAECTDESWEPKWQVSDYDIYESQQEKDSGVVVVKYSPK